MGLGIAAADAQSLRIGMRDDPDILDPTFSRTYIGTVIMTAICDKLVDFDAQLGLVPGLATGWEWTDSQTLVMKLRPGVVFQNGDAARVQADAKLRLISVSSLGYGSLTINIGPEATTPLGRDVRVRRALELSIDRTALIQVAFAGMYTPNAQATSALSPLYAPGVAPGGRDVARAKALLREAGVTTPLAIPFSVANTPQGLQVGEIIQSMAAEAGFDIKVQAMEFGALLAAVNRGAFALSLGGWSGLLDTDSNSWSMLHSGGALNMARYSNAKVDALLDAARTTTDLAQRRADYQAVWQQVNADLPVIYLWTPRNIIGVSKSVSGVSFLSDGLLRLQDVRVEK